MKTMAELFSSRYGYEPPKIIQIGTLDDACKNRLWNRLKECCEYYDLDACSEHFFEVNYVLDKIGKEKVSAPIETRKNAISTIHEVWNETWYRAFDVLEAYISFFVEFEMAEQETECVVAFNKILEEERSGYRFIRNKAVPITNQGEQELLAQSTQSDFDNVNTHFEKAIALYADRQKPDYENSIKESISAVEAICCIITGETGSQATLGKTLKRLEDHGVTIHASMREAFSKLYGYTSDADGIRHGGIDFTNAPAEDAKYMLLSCSAFVNYLIEKYSKMGGNS